MKYSYKIKVGDILITTKTTDMWSGTMYDPMNIKQVQLDIGSHVVVKALNVYSKDVMVVIHPHLGEISTHIQYNNPYYKDWIVSHFDLVE